MVDSVQWDEDGVDVDDSVQWDEVSVDVDDSVQWDEDVLLLWLNS